MRRFRAPNGLKTNASVFEGKGYPWISERDRIADRETRKSVVTMTPEQINLAVDKARLLNEMHSRIGGKVKPQADYSETVTYLDENPDWDAVTKAGRAKPHREQVGKLAKIDKPVDEYRKRVNAFIAFKKGRGSR